jgi:hypothetical protein
MSAILEITPKGRSTFKDPSSNVDGSASGQRPSRSQDVQPTPFACRRLSFPVALLGVVGSWFVLLLTLSIVCCFSLGLFARPIGKIQHNSADTISAQDSLHYSPSITISNLPDSLTQSDFQNPKWAGNWFRLFHIDVDSDGNPDLVGVARSWKLFVWLNNGRGHYRRHNFAGKVLTCAEESAQTSIVLSQNDNVRFDQSRNVLLRRSTLLVFWKGEQGGERGRTDDETA